MHFTNVGKGPNTCMTVLFSEGTPMEGFEVAHQASTRAHLHALVTMAETEVAADAVTNGEADADPSPPKRSIVKRLPRPDQSLVKAQIEKLKDEISQNQQRQDKIREELEKRRSGRTTSTEQQTIKNRLMELRSQFQSLLVGAADPLVGAHLRAAVPAPFGRTDGSCRLPLHSSGRTCIEPAPRDAPTESFDKYPLSSMF